jgi:hypothetical protein
MFCSCCRVCGACGCARVCVRVCALRRQGFPSSSPSHFASGFALPPAAVRAACALRSHRSSLRLVLFAPAFLTWPAFVVSACPGCEALDDSVVDVLTAEPPGPTGDRRPRNRSLKMLRFNFCGKLADTTLNLVADRLPDLEVRSTTHASRPSRPVRPVRPVRRPSSGPVRPSVRPSVPSVRAKSAAGAAISCRQQHGRKTVWSPLSVRPVRANAAAAAAISCRRPTTTRKEDCVAPLCPLDAHLVSRSSFLSLCAGFRRVRLPANVRQRVPVRWVIWQPRSHSPSLSLAVVVGIVAVAILTTTRS